MSVHTCLFAPTGREFTKVAQTMDNGSVVQRSSFFPNKQYGLNGRHLRIATLPVDIEKNKTVDITIKLKCRFVRLSGIGGNVAVVCFIKQLVS